MYCSHGMQNLRQVWPCRDVEGTILLTKAIKRCFQKRNAEGEAGSLFPSWIFSLLSLSLKYTHMDSILWITERGQYGADVIRKRQLSSLVGVSIVHGHGHMDTLV